MACKERLKRKEKHCGREEVTCPQVPLDHIQDCSRSFIHIKCLGRRLIQGTLILIQGIATEILTTKRNELQKCFSREAILGLLVTGQNSATEPITLFSFIKVGRPYEWY